MKSAASFKQDGGGPEFPLTHRIILATRRAARKSCLDEWRHAAWSRNICCREGQKNTRVRRLCGRAGTSRQRQHRQGTFASRAVAVHFAAFLSLTIGRQVHGPVMTAVIETPEIPRFSDRIRRCCCRSRRPAALGSAERGALLVRGAMQAPAHLAASEQLKMDALASTYQAHAHVQHNQQRRSRNAPDDDAPASARDQLEN